MAGLLPRAYSF